MPFQARTTRSKRFVAESETLTQTMRLFDTETNQRMCSYTVSNAGNDEARVTDLTMVAPFEMNKRLFLDIGFLLKETGYKKVAFERFIKRGVLKRKEYTL